MKNHSLESRSRLRPCLSCGQEFRREFQHCPNCGAERGRTKETKMESEVINDKTGVNPPFRELKGEKIFFGCLSVVFIYIPILITAFLYSLYFETSFFDGIRYEIREIGRSRLYLSLIAAVLTLGIVFIAGYFSGWHIFKGKFIQAIKDTGNTLLFHHKGKDAHANSYWTTRIFNEVRNNKLDAYLFVPFTNDIFSEKSCLIIPYLNRLLLLEHDYKMKRLIVVLVFLALMILGMTAKNYNSFNKGFNEQRILFNLVLDIILISGSFYVGYISGRGNFKRRITCNWFKSQLQVVGKYLCVRRCGYIYICPAEYIHEFSIKDAEKVFEANASADLIRS
ncbi:MAG TPA: hypothetical protein VHU19_16120 [Pyrinomonadaceae bacterium]|jgi:hypothetical protein|nr:hypothetical protein [Pyrinomonadaceae bacterium]